MCSWRACSALSWGSPRGPERSAAGKRQPWAARLRSRPRPSFGCLSLPKSTSKAQGAKGKSNKGEKVLDGPKHIRAFVTKCRSTKGRELGTSSSSGARSARASANFRSSLGFSNLNEAPAGLSAASGFRSSSVIMAPYRRNRVPNNDLPQFSTSTKKKARPRRAARRSGRIGRSISRWRSGSASSRQARA